MITRHRFLGVAGEAVNTVLCGEGFGDLARCTLPYDSEWHYRDDEHPWTPADGRPGECGWRLQEGVWGENVILCSGDQSDNMHVPFPATDGELLPRSIPTPTPITVTMEYPRQEAPMDQQQPPQGWAAGNVYPPSDDGGARVEAEPATERLHAVVPGYTDDGRKFNPDGTLPDKTGVNVNTGDPQPEWSRAAGFLQSEDVSLNYGPWPVRKFLLADGYGLETYTEHDLYIEYVEALDRIAEDYTVQVYRPDGKPWRFALVTWGLFNGYTLETACDELAAVYG